MAREKTISTASEIENNIEYEIQLLHAMQGSKPVGVSKYFQMTCIIDKFQENIEKTVNSKAVWDHLNRLYDMQQLDEMEAIPFPNHEAEFSLPDKEYHYLKQKKIDSIKFGRSTPEKPSTPNTSSKSSTSVSKKNESTKDNSIRSPATVHKDYKKEATSNDKSKHLSHRRDSSSQSHREQSTPKSSSNSKKEVSTPVSSKRDVDRKVSQFKGRSSSTPTSTHSRRDEDSKDKSHKDNSNSKQKEDLSSSKRTTRGSVKPDELLQDHHKSQSPLTVTGSSTPTNSSAAKRRRI